MDRRAQSAQTLPPQAAETIPAAESTLPAAEAPLPDTGAGAAWQVVGAVVRGAAHERLGLPCQDAQDYRVQPGGVLLVALADGAGSAPFSDQGARSAVSEALNALTAALASPPPEDGEGWRALLREVFASARSAVLRLAKVNKREGLDPASGELPAGNLPAIENQPAAEIPSLADEPPVTEEPDQVVDVPAPETLGLPDDALSAADVVTPEPAASEPQASPAELESALAREYATTLTCVVATVDRLVVGQIGDGVVVAGEGGELFAVTRLQRGEYANETHFLTQADALDQLDVQIVERPVDALAVMSDGLIRLALKLPAQQPHAPFFQPLFRVVAGLQDKAEAARQLAGFLGSDRVNARTDDDKSLVLAVRAAFPRESVGRQAPEEDTINQNRTAEDAGRAASALD